MTLSIFNNRIMQKKRRRKDVMSLVKETEQYLSEVLSGLGYELDSVKLEKSKMPEFGQYQINCSMQLAKKYGDDKAPSFVKKLLPTFA